METTRATFLRRGAQGGLALVAGGSLLGLAEGTALGAPTADSDIAKLAATAELLAIDFYRRAIASRKFSRDELAYMQAALANEQAHYKALAGVLKSAARRAFGSSTRIEPSPPRRRSACSARRSRPPSSVRTWAPSQRSSRTS
jgi:Ferritin-like domain